jgi:hypothetical protein
VNILAFIENRPTFPGTFLLFQPIYGGYFSSEFKIFANIYKDKLEVIGECKMQSAKCKMKELRCDYMPPSDEGGGIFVRK